MRQQLMQAQKEDFLRAQLPAGGGHPVRSVRQISMLVSAVVHKVI